MFKLFSDIYFVVYKLYYVGQNDNLGIRVSLKNWDRGSTYNLCNLRNFKNNNSWRTFVYKIRFQFNIPQSLQRLNNEWYD
jgi:hypothetical protein